MIKMFVESNWDNIFSCKGMLRTFLHVMPTNQISPCPFIHVRKVHQNTSAADILEYASKGYVVIVEPADAVYRLMLCLCCRLGADIARQGE
jgi:hypothetical protein